MIISRNKIRPFSSALPRYKTLCLFIFICHLLFSVNAQAASNPAAVISQARVSMAYGRVREALVNLSTFVFENPDNPMASEAWFLIGECHERTGDRRKALYVFQKLSEDGSYMDKAGLLLKLSSLSALLEDYSNAYGYMNSLIQMNPANRDYLEKAAEMLIHLNRHEEAVDVMMHRLKLQPPPSTVFTDKIVNSLKETGKSDESWQELYKKGIESKLSHSERKLIIRLALPLKKVEETAQLILKQKTANIRTLTFEVNDLYSAAGKFNEAVSLLKKYASEKPYDLGIALELARALVSSGNKDEAVSILMKTAKETNTPDSWKQISKALQNLGFTEKALLFNTNALKLTNSPNLPEHIRSRYRLMTGSLLADRAEILRVLGHIDDAASTALQSYESGHKESINLLEEILSSSTDSEKSLQILLGTLNQQSSSRATLTDIAMRLGLFTQAENAAIQHFTYNPSRQVWILKVAEKLAQRGKDVRNMLHQIIERLQQNGNPAIKEVKQGALKLLAEQQLEADEAQKCLETLKQADDKDNAVLALKTLALSASGKHNLALKELPQGDEYSALRGRTLASAGRFMDAWEELASLPPDPESTMLRAHVGISESLFASSEVLLIEILGMDSAAPEIPEAVWLLDLYNRRRDNPKALQRLSAAIACTFRPASVNGLLNVLLPIREDPDLVAWVLDKVADDMEKYSRLHELLPAMTQASLHPGLLFWRALATIDMNSERARLDLQELIKKYPSTPESIHARRLLRGESNAIE